MVHLIRSRKYASSLDFSPPTQMVTNTSTPCLTRPVIGSRSHLRSTCSLCAQSFIVLSVPIQYMLAAFRGHIPAEQLLKYRAAYSGLPGHPELHHSSAEFSSGRLGRKLLPLVLWSSCPYQRCSSIDMVNSFPTHQFLSIKTIYSGPS